MARVVKRVCMACMYMYMHVFYGALSDSILHIARWIMSVYLTGCTTLKCWDNFLKIFTPSSDFLYWQTWKIWSSEIPRTWARSRVHNSNIKIGKGSSNLFAAHAPTHAGAIGGHSFNHQDRSLRDLLPGDQLDVDDKWQDQLQTSGSYMYHIRTLSPLHWGLKWGQAVQPGQ